jgi:hypothetical protein
MSDKVRVYEVAEESGSTSQEVILKAKNLGIQLKSPQSALSFQDAEEITNYIMTGKSSKLLRSKNSEVVKSENIKVVKFDKNNLEKIEKPHTTFKNKAISKNKIRIVSKHYQKDITIKKDIIENEITSENDLENDTSNIKKQKTLIPNSNNERGEKEELFLNSFPEVTIEITNLKNIPYLKWKLQKEKGVYGIIGENGSGKSSLLISISKLVNRNVFKNEFIGVGHYENSKITYYINDIKVNWIKKQSTDNQWRQELSDKYIMPKLTGFFESSILSGTRFNKIDYYIKSELEYKKNEDSIEKSNNFIIDEMNYVLYGKHKHLYKFDALYKINAKRKRKNDTTNKMNEKNYSYYVLKLNDNEYLKEQLFSTGEYFLLQLLKFLTSFVNIVNIVPPLIIIDEIEISLHPLAQERLIERLNYFCEKYNIIAFFASHSFHIIENINIKNRFYINKKEDNKINIENSIDMGYLTAKLYKHKFYDFIILVEDNLAQEYVNLTVNELVNEIKLNYAIISTGGADKVLEMARKNSSYKYFGEAKLIPIVDEDKKHLLSNYENTPLGGTFIPVEKFIENYIYPIYFENNTILRNKFSEFIQKNYSPNTLDSLKYIWNKNNNQKNTYLDICYKIAELQNPKSEEMKEHIAKETKIKLVEFIYIENKNTELHQKFTNRLKKFFKI